MTSVGEFTVSRPKAGPRNRAMIKADQGDVLKRTILVTELLPSSITAIPPNLDKHIPIASILDGLELDDYDLLSSTMMELLESSKDKEEAAKEEEQKKTLS